MNNDEMSMIFKIMKDKGPGHMGPPLWGNIFGAFDARPSETNEGSDILDEIE